MKYIKILTLVFAVLIWVGVVQAKVSGPCSNCHTMHNSQDGSAVETGGPYRALTKGDCVGCHTGDITAGTKPTIPYVLATAAPSYSFGTISGRTILAGGNFYWVKNASTNPDAKGHNVVGVANQDGALGLTPPGYQQNYGTTARPSSWNQQLTCAGTYGCHGDPNYSDQFEAISGAHHGDDSTIDGTTVAKSFRFLLGVKGTEDSDWELTASTSDHNGYYAVNRSAGNLNSPDDPASINALCAQCHGAFHASVDYDSTAGSPWLRHPTDYDMNNVSAKEYGQYPNPTLFSNNDFGVANVGDYFPDVPVGNTVGAANSQVLQAAGDAIVLCISCHKAHGSPYDDLLRWDYSTCTAGSANANCGCFACHTTK